jgi:hypothetical protein
MDLGVRRIMLWWGTLVLALVLLAVGVFGFIIVSGELAWYNTPVSAARDALDGDMGDYVRVEGRIALNATTDVVIRAVEVEKAIWMDTEYEYDVAFFYVEDGRGDAVLVLFDHVSETKAGRHDGDYHKGDEVCIGGTVAVEGTGLRALRADFVARHSVDTHARYVMWYVSSILGGGLLAIGFALTRLFLSPRKDRGRDWRVT